MGNTIRYELELLLHLKESPLCVKPKELPAPEEYMGYVHSVGSRPGASPSMLIQNTASQQTPYGLKLKSPLTVPLDHWRNLNLNQALAGLRLIVMDPAMAVCPGRQLSQFLTYTNRQPQFLTDWSLGLLVPRFPAATLELPSAKMTAMTRPSVTPNLEIASNVPRWEPPAVTMTPGLVGGAPISEAVTTRIEKAKDGTRSSRAKALGKMGLSASLDAWAAKVTDNNETTVARIATTLTHSRTDVAPLTPTARMATRRAGMALPEASRTLGPGKLLSSSLVSKQSGP